MTAPDGREFVLRARNEEEAKKWALKNFNLAKGKKIKSAKDLEAEELIDGYRKTEISKRTMQSKKSIPVKVT